MISSCLWLNFTKISLQLKGYLAEISRRVQNLLTVAIAQGNGNGGNSYGFSFKVCVKLMNEGEPLIWVT